MAITAARSTKGELAGATCYTFHTGRNQLWVYPSQLLWVYKNQKTTSPIIQFQDYSSGSLLRYAMLIVAGSSHLDLQLSTRCSGCTNQRDDRRSEQISIHFGLFWLCRRCHWDHHGVRKAIEWDKLLLLNTLSQQLSNIALKLFSYNEVIYQVSHFCFFNAKNVADQSHRSLRLKNLMKQWKNLQGAWLS